MAKGNISRGYQKTLVSGENIKTIDGKSVLGAGDLATRDMLVDGAFVNAFNHDIFMDSGNSDVGRWKYLGGRENETETSFSQIDISLASGNSTFAFESYSKFLLVAEVTPTSDRNSRTYENFQIFFTANNSKVYGVYYDTTYPKNASEAFYTLDIMIERQQELNGQGEIVYGNKCFSTAVITPYSSNNSPAATTSIFRRARNNGDGSTSAIDSLRIKLPDWGCIEYSVKIYGLEV